MKTLYENASKKYKVKKQKFMDKHLEVKEPETICKPRTQESIVKHQSGEEYEVVEKQILPEKIICPDCGGITLDGLDFCHKCGGELY